MHCRRAPRREARSSPEQGRYVSRTHEAACELGLLFNDNFGRSRPHFEFAESNEKTGLIPESPGVRSTFDRDRSGGARNLLARFGIEPPKRDPAASVRQPSRTEWIGGRNRRGQEVSLSRQELYEPAWSAPVERLGKDWGLSGRGLAKGCRRLQIPVPPLGYWARFSAGARTARPPNADPS